MFPFNNALHIINILKYFSIVNGLLVNHNFYGGKIMISYEPLWQTMKSKGITTYNLIHDYDINTRTIYNLKHNKGITTYTLEKLCSILNCTPNDIIEFVEEEKGQQ